MLTLTRDEDVNALKCWISRCRGISQERLSALVLLAEWRAERESMRTERVGRRVAVVAATGFVVALAGCGGSRSTSDRPAGFAAQARQICRQANGRFKVFKRQLQSVQSATGTQRDKRAKLATLLQSMGRAARDVHDRLAKLQPPKTQAAAYHIYLSALGKMASAAEGAGADVKANDVQGLRHDLAWIGEAQRTGHNAAMNAPALAPCEK